MSLLRLSLGCFLLSLPLLGCGSSVHGFDGEGGSGGTGQVVTGGGGGAKRALAMTESEFFALSSRTSVSGSVTATSGATVGPGGGTDSSVVTTGGSTGIEYLYVFIDRSDQAVSTCGDPFAAAQVCDRDRDIAVVRIQPSHQAVGSYVIGDGDVVGYSFSSANDCTIDQGDIWETGLIEIISIDDNSVRLRVVAGPKVPEIEIVADRC